MASFESLITDIRERLETVELSLINIDKEAAIRELNEVSSDIDGIESLLRFEGLIVPDEPN